mmetsp:Transcript_36363/g.108062  ORF Transcript_36363/g.108062 Transcript_36363/m.108062 type:complete len:208 (+) Transcript_36363:289-912(+)
MFSRCAMTTLPAACSGPATVASSMALSFSSLTAAASSSAVFRYCCMVCAVRIFAIWNGLAASTAPFAAFAAPIACSALAMFTVRATSAFIVEMALATASFTARRTAASSFAGSPSMRACVSCATVTASFSIIFVRSAATSAIRAASAALNSDAATFACAISASSAIKAVCACSCAALASLEAQERAMLLFSTFSEDWATDGTPGITQ